MPNVTLKLITVQLCKEAKIEKMKKTQKISENYEENVVQILPTTIVTRFYSVKKAIFSCRA